MRGVDPQEVARWLEEHPRLENQDCAWRQGVSLLVQTGHPPYIWFAQRARREECIAHCAARLAAWLKKKSNT